MLTGPYSKTSAAIRQRRSRAKRRAGLRSFRLYIPEKKIIAVVRTHENLGHGEMPSQQMIEHVISEGIEWWAGAWLKVERK